MDHNAIIVETTNYDKIYAEASQWVRMANNLIWATGSIFVPLSLFPLWSLVTSPSTKLLARLVMAMVSISLFLLWTFITTLYKDSTATARQVLINIENAWGITSSLALNQLQSEILKKGRRITKIQIIALCFLLSLWAVGTFLI